MSRGFLLDTNVLSELMRAEPAVEVMAWFQRQTDQAMYTSAVTQAEILTGIALLPQGKRRSALALAAEQLFDVDMAARCLGFDGAAAKQYALIVAQRTRLGKPISTEDAQIAAIALANACDVVTRNVTDFANISGLVVVNPWVPH